jgi:hypothetical protein
MKRPFRYFPDRPNWRMGSCFVEPFNNVGNGCALNHEILVCSKKSSGDLRSKREDISDGQVTILAILFASFLLLKEYFDGLGSSAVSDIGYPVSR